MPKFKEPEVEVKFINNCFEVVMFWRLKRRAKRLHANRRSQGVQWVHLHPQSGEKSRRNLQGKFVSAPKDTKCTPGRARVNF